MSAELVPSGPLRIMMVFTNNNDQPLQPDEIARQADMSLATTRRHLHSCYLTRFINRRKAYYKPLRGAELMAAKLAEEGDQ